MAVQKTSSKASEGPQNAAPLKHEDCLPPAFIELVRLLARSAAKEAFEASTNTPTDANNAKN